MTDPKYRLWIYRIVAPIAFFLAAIILVVLIQKGLSNDSTSSSATDLPTVSSSTSTTSPTTTGKKKKHVYHVKAGDTLESIAAKFDTTVDDLLALNPGIDPLALSPGEKVRVA